MTVKMTKTEMSLDITVVQFIADRLWSDYGWSRSDPDAQGQDPSPYSRAKLDQVIQNLEIKTSDGTVDRSWQAPLNQWLTEKKITSDADYIESVVDFLKRAKKVAGDDVTKWKIMGLDDTKH